MSTNKLYFNYPSTAKIRFKLENVYGAEEWPAVYAIVTKRLTFLVPKKAMQITKNHAYIPLELYRDALNNYYKSLRK